MSARPFVPPEFRLTSYAYELPLERIAARPSPRRDSSRLLVLRARTGEIELAHFQDLGQFLPAGSLLVANESRVYPARLIGTRPSGGKVELLLLTPPAFLAGKPQPSGLCTAEAQVLLKPAGRLRIGETIAIAPNLSAVLLEKGAFGRCRVGLAWRDDLAAIIEQTGRMPLPPYIRREPDPADRERYQTVYASRERTGSAAAPTAGLHFTGELIAQLRAAGFGLVFVTLHVGYGTFSPVRCADIREHIMHSEWFEVPEETAEAIGQARAEGRPVVAIGTTTARALEGLARERGQVAAHRGATDIFIRPGHEFRAVDHLITNFHLPGSSLLIMVSALAGRENIQAAYARALAEGFRFFSYGDAMLIVR